MPLKILSLTCDFILVVIHSISSEFSNDFDHMMNANWATIFVSFSLHMHGAQFPVFDISTLYFLLCCTAILSVLYFFLQQFTFLSRVFLRYEMHSSNSTILHHHLRSTKLLLFFKKKKAAELLVTIYFTSDHTTFVCYLSLNSPLKV